MERKERNPVEIDWSSRDLPSLPRVANRLIDLSRNEEIRLSEIEDIISADPSLSLKILKAANSAFYSLNVEVTSIRHAIMLLGTDEVRRIAISAVFAGHFRAVPPEAKPFAEALWRHTMAVAILAQDFTDGDEEPDPYTLGLLHDIGWLLLLVQRPSRFISVANEQKGTVIGMERLWGLDHQLWGARLSELWGLPEPFQVVSLRHHDPFRDLAPPEYLLKVTLANHLANDIGFRMHALPLEPLPEAIFSTLPIDGPAYQEMRKAAFDDRDRIDAFCRQFFA